MQRLFACMALHSLNFLAVLSSWTQPTSDRRLRCLRMIAEDICCHWNLYKSLLEEFWPKPKPTISGSKGSLQKDLGKGCTSLIRQRQTFVQLLGDPCYDYRLLFRYACIMIMSKLIGVCSCINIYMWCVLMMCKHLACHHLHSVIHFAIQSMLCQSYDGV